MDMFTDFISRKDERSMWQKINHKVQNKLMDIHYAKIGAKAYFIRGKKGYAPSDLWNFDYYLCNLIANALKDFKKNKMGFPSFLEEDEQWDAILDKIIDGFECGTKLLNNELCLEDDDLETYWDAVERFNEGFALFTEWFAGLWD